MSALAKVLVVDDDPVVSKSFDRVLSGKGYVVVTARDGEEALRRIRDEDYDVVFTDIRMPGMDGIAVAEKVKARRPWTPVVIVTGYGTRDNQARARAAGVSDFLHKPLSPEMIEDSTLRALHEVAPAIGTPAAATATAAAAPVEPQARWNPADLARDVGMAIAGPFIGLAFVLALPFAGLAGLAWLLAREALRVPAVKAVAVFVRDVALFLAAPFIGLAYLVLGPLVGLAALLWFGGKALLGRKA